MSLEEAIEDLTREIRNLGEHIRRGERLVTFTDTVEGQSWGLGPEIGLEPSPPEPEEPVELAIGENTQVLELIALAKELGYDYLYHEGQLVVDNRVMDEYNRRTLGDGLEREI